MLQLTPSHPFPQPPSIPPQSLPFSLIQTGKTQQEAEQYHALSLKTGTFHHPSVASRFLSLYADAKINNLDYARSFDQIEQSTLLSWNLLIKSYVGNQRSHYAIVLFHEMLHELVPDNFTLPCVIKVVHG